MVFRNDDVSKDTDIQQFSSVHELFIKYNVLHTVALICKDIELNQPLIDYINANNIDVQVHCWDHVDFTVMSDDQVFDQLLESILEIKKYFNKTPDTFYPPWNRVNFDVKRVAMAGGLTVSNTKISISQYLAGKQGEVINFHSWSDECNDLEAALKKYTS